MTKSTLKVAVVTGASAGVGRAIATQLARRGWRVGLIARGAEGLDGAKREIEAQGGEALKLSCDVADAQAVFAAAEQITDRWDGIDVWVNNAMATIFARFVDVTPEEFRRVTNVTYLGQVYGTMAALQHMRKRGSGTIIQIGSALSYRAIPLQSAYCGAKFAIRGFTDSLRSELDHAGSKIRLCMIQLPAVNTPQFDWSRSRFTCRPQPLPPVYSPQTIGDVIADAAEDPSPEIWLGAPSAKAILGQFVMPRFLDHYLARTGYEGQLSNEVASAQEGNLFTPVPADYGAAGRFTAQERHTVSAFNPTWVRAGLAATAITLVVAGMLLVRWGS